MKKITTWLVLLVFTLSAGIVLTACQNNTQDFYSSASYINVNTKDSNYLSFSLTLFSKKKIKDVKVLGAEGIGFKQEELLAEITDSTIDEISSKKFKGFHIKTLLIELTPNAELNSVTVSAVVLLIDNESRKIHFANKIEHEYTKGVFYSDILEIRSIPVEFSSSAITKGASFSYEFVAKQNLVLEDSYCLDFLDIKILNICIDDITIENVVLPFEVQEGQKLTIILSYKSENLTEFDYSITNLYFSFRTQDDELHYNAFVVSFDSLYPIMNNDTSHINNFIEKLISDTKIN